MADSTIPTIPKNINFVPSQDASKDLQDYIKRLDEIYRYLGADLSNVFANYVRRDGTLGLTGEWNVDNQNIIGIANLIAATAQFGSATDYSEFEADGTYQMVGNATVWRDELNDLVGSRLESPSSRIIQNNAEGSVTFQDNADLTDYVTMSIQINHQWKLGSGIRPHIHWWQAQSDMPNWLVQYRWQSNGSAKDTTWTDIPWATNQFTYVSGTLNQITNFGTITPPDPNGLSDIVQIRLLRDNANDSGEFDAVDPVTGDVDAVNLDIHVENDTLGSRTEFIK